MGKVNYLRVSAVKGLVKTSGRRSGKEFVEELDRVVGQIVERACKQESKKKTLEASDVKVIVDSMTVGVPE